MNFQVGGTLPHFETRIVKALQNVNAEATNKAKSLGDGNTIDFKPETKADRERFDSLTETLAKDTKSAEVAKDAATKMKQDAETLFSIQQKLADMAQFTQNFTPTTDAHVQTARNSAQAVLDLIANSFLDNVIDRNSVQNVSNLNPDGSANDGYVLLRNQDDAIELPNGTRLAISVSIEDLKDVIGAANAIKTATNVANPLGVAFPANVTTLFDSGNRKLSIMLGDAKSKQEIAEKYHTDLETKIAESKDALDDFKNAKHAEIAFEMSEAARLAEMLQALAASKHNLSRRMIETTQSMVR